MTVTAWRIVKARLAREAFSGEGARRLGGRWNSPGLPVVYTSCSQSLATLEMLVHLGSQKLLGRYVIIPVSFDDGLVESVDLVRLPASWRRSPVSPAARAIGDRWLREMRSAVLRVPSTVVPGEVNFLINPLHQDFKSIRIGKSQRFRFDPRLGK